MLFEPLRFDGLGVITAAVDKHNRRGDRNKLGHKFADEPNIGQRSEDGESGDFGVAVQGDHEEGER